MTPDLPNQLEFYRRHAGTESALAVVFIVSQSLSLETRS
jgi:hypothetical protein